MNIAFFTEMNFTGKIPRDHTNMRTEFAWMCALEADHWNINDMPDTSYDLGILIKRKNKRLCSIGSMSVISRHHDNKQPPALPLAGPIE